MSTKRITFIVKKNGDGVVMEVDGCTGPECRDLTKPFREDLGGRPGTEEKKPEFHEAKVEGLGSVQAGG